MTVPGPASRFDQLYEQSSDPWNYRTSAYERQKYKATLAAIPAGPVPYCLEVGCSIGVFTKMLAGRCENVVAIDFSERAVMLAAENLKGVRNVDIRAEAFPVQVPTGRWNVIICSEVLYYLEEPLLAAATRWLQAQLVRGACVIAVSWRGAGTDEPFRGDDVHDKLMIALTDYHSLDARTDGYRLDRFGGRP